MKNEANEIFISEKKLRNKTIIAFVGFIAFLAGAIFFWQWIHKQPEIAQAPTPVRRVLELNETFFSTFLRDNHLAPTYPKSAAARHARVNGNIGLKSTFDTAAWKLQLIRRPGDTMFLALNDLRSLPKTEIVFNFKCIEGWSQITDWAGVKFSDFMKKYGLDAQAQMKYVALATPDKEYYVGIDMPSMLHPQTLLCYELNGKPLPLDQGYPLRLIIPVKYGIKSLKRIGTLSFGNERPPDYWYERGYDYYSGL